MGTIECTLKAPSARPKPGGRARCSGRTGISSARVPGGEVLGARHGKRAEVAAHPGHPRPAPRGWQLGAGLDPRGGQRIG